MLQRHPAPRRAGHFTLTGLPMNVQLYGIPNCDNVRKARRWLDEHQQAYVFHDFHREGVTESDLDFWLDRLGWETILNRSSTTWRQLDAAQKAPLDNQSIKSLFQQYPTLIKRPLWVVGDHIVLGVKPEQWQATLNTL